MTNRLRGEAPSAPAATAAVSGGPVEGKRTLSQGFPVQRKAGSPAGATDPVATPGNSAPTATDDPYGFHVPVQRKAGRVGAGTVTEQKCLEEHDKTLVDPDSPDATDRLELDDGKAAYTPSFNSDGKLTSIAKRYHDKFNNMSVVVIIQVDPPRKVSEAKAKAKIDAFAKDTYRAWLAERADVISQLCAQRKPLEIEERLDLGDDEPDITPDQPKPDQPKPDPPKPDQPPGPASSASPASIPVYFDHGKDVPLNIAGVLEVVRTLHHDRPHATVRLDGHASSIGPDKVNSDLSRRRVAAVRRALAGIAGLEVPARDGEAHGERDAQATEAGKAGAELTTAQTHNRRVDISLVD